MKTHFKNSSLLLALIAALGLMLAGDVTAQTFTILHHFTGTGTGPFGAPVISADGAYPYDSLVLVSNTFYGTAFSGGTNGTGTLFAINPDGSGFTNLHSFAATNSAGNNSEGMKPVAGLIAAGNTLYGAAYKGGTADSGTVFAMKTDGTGFTNLHNFSNQEKPYGALLLVGTNLFGTTLGGGSANLGMVFAIGTNGSGFTNLHSFSVYGKSQAGLVLSGNILYGATFGGDSTHDTDGSVFQIKTDGSGFLMLTNFAGRVSATLLLASNVLYGTTFNTGSAFAVKTDGTGFATLHVFSGTAIEGGFILANHLLYGTTCNFVSITNGSIFAMNPDGSGLTNLHTFSASDKANPYSSLTLVGNALYGTTQFGGANGTGTVFKLSFTPTLAIQLTGAKIVLSWPTNVAGFDYTGFTLQATTNLASTNWSTVSPPPIPVNGQNTVTNPVSGTQMFYRLKQ